MSLAERLLSLLASIGRLRSRRPWVYALPLLLAACAQPGFSAPDLPGRVGRIASSLAPARLESGTQAKPLEASRDDPLLNWPVASQDRVSTGPGGRMELDFGSTRVRVGERTRLDVQKLDDDELVLALRQGQVSVWVRNPDVAGGVVLRTARSTVRPLGAALFRVDAAGSESTAGTDHVTAWRAPVEIEQSRSALRLNPGQRAELNDRGDWRLGTPRSDAFAQWALNTEEPLPADQPPLGEMTGVQALSSHGQWSQTAEYGWIWTPLRVDIGWAPYQRGRWVWMSPWGWTWVDAAPWGFAPFHYGQWIEWNGRWHWAPGHTGSRPIYAPSNRPPPHVSPPPRYDDRRHIPVMPPRVAPSPQPRAPEPRMPEPVWRTHTPDERGQPSPRFDPPRHDPPGRDERTRPMPPPNATIEPPQRRTIPEPRRPYEPSPQVIETPRMAPPRAEPPRQEPPRTEPPRAEPPRMSPPAAPAMPMPAPVREPSEPVRRRFDPPAPSPAPPAPAPRSEERGGGSPAPGNDWRRRAL